MGRDDGPEARPGPTLAGPDTGRGQKMKEFALRETRQFTIMFLYLWIIFALFVLNETIILGFDYTRLTMQGFAAINALLLAKVMMVAEELDLGRWLDRRPLIYPIVTEALVLVVAFVCFHAAEEVVVGLIRGKSLADSRPTWGGGGLAGAICVSLILFVGLLPYFAFKHFVRVLGWEKVRALLFGTTDGA
jgi:hypothetical protein